MNKRLLSTFRQLLRRTADRLQGLQYIHRGIILALDLLCSAGAAIGTCLLFHSIEGTQVSATYLCHFTLVITIISSIIFGISRFYRIIIRHSNIRSIPRIIIALAINAAAVCAVGIIFDLAGGIKQAITLCILYFFFACLLIIGLRIAMICGYYTILHLDTRRNQTRSTKCFVCGRLEDLPAFADFLNSAYRGHYLPTAFIDLDKETSHLAIAGTRLYAHDDAPQLRADIAANIPDAIIFTSPAALRAEQKRLIPWCPPHIKLLVSPAITDSSHGTAQRAITPVQIEDLLERAEITIDSDTIAAQITGKTILVTGAAGSIGSELVRQLCNFTPSRIILLDSAETPLHLIRLEIENRHPNIPITPIMADVRNRVRCADIIATHRPSIIFHAAAYKHVPLVEENPCEGIITNILGSVNMAELAREHNVEQFVMISTDKAVNPTNVMGATKRAAEMYVQSLNTALRNGSLSSPAPCTTRYTTTRFGNVLGSNGSVVPLFREQIAKGGPITVTHPDIIRYFMTIPEACRLVLQAGTMGTGGEIFVFDMGEPVKIVRLARRMITLSGLKPDIDIKIEYTGLRPGEKLYEEVLSSTESTTETHHHKIRIAKAIDNPFTTIRSQTETIIAAATALHAEEAVRALKQLVPEFKSKNSPYEKLDDTPQHC